MSDTVAASTINNQERRCRHCGCSQFHGASYAMIGFTRIEAPSTARVSKSLSARKLVSVHQVFE